MSEPTGPGTPCGWCRQPIPPGKRRDAVTCSKVCRQARHRYAQLVGTGAAPIVDTEPRRLAYADPPYVGKSARYYSGHPDYAGEVDHEALFASLAAEYDAWALSCSAESLPMLLRLPTCPVDVRVGSWHRGVMPNYSATAPINGWEAVIYAGQIRRQPSPGSPRRVDVLETLDEGPDTLVDVLRYRAAPRSTDPNRVIGAKSAVFSAWIFGLLGASPIDTFVDVFPGSGGVARAWSTWAGPVAAAGHDDTFDPTRSGTIPA